MTPPLLGGNPLLEWLLDGDGDDVLLVDAARPWTRRPLVEAVARRADALGALGGARRGVGVPREGEGIAELLAVVAAGGRAMVGVDPGQEPPAAWDPPGSWIMAVPTSGSTRASRWVALGCEGIRHVAECTVTTLELCAGERLFCPLPLAHSYGLTQLWCSLRAGATLVLPPRPLVGRDWARARDCAVVAAIAPHAEALLAVRLNPRAVTLAGQGTAPAVRRRLAAAMPTTSFHVFYGLTEATSRVLALPPGEFLAAPEATGYPLPGTVTRLVDDELWVQGPQLSPGYLDDPQATARGFADGWLRTGDVFAVEGARHSFRGRRDGMVKRHGEKVFVERVESTILDVPGVVDARVFAVDDELVAEVVGQDVQTVGLRAAVRRALGGASVPDRVVVVPTVDRTAAGKLRR